MTAREPDPAVEAAAEALAEFYGSPSPRGAEDAVAAVREVIAADIEAHRDGEPAMCQADRDFDTETLAAACRTAAVASAHADLLNAVAARMLAMLSWIDGAKVDLDGYDDARAAIDRVRALHVDEWVVIDYVGGYVCRECREPVESEPCATIRALDGGATDPQTQEGP